MSEFIFHLVPFESCVEEVITFRNANREIIRDRCYFEWRYDRRPCGSKAMIVWGSDDRGHKVSVASIIPHDYYILDGVYPVGVLGDISVIPACRGHGVATSMFHYLQQQQAIQALRLCIVLPNDAVAHALERAGWCTVASIARFVKVVDMTNRLPSWLIGRRGIARMINNMSRFASLDGWSSQGDSPYHVVELESIGDEFNDLWNEIPKQGRMLAVRDKNYLQWRYQQHPTVNYRIIGILQGDHLRGYVVFHVAGDAVEIDDFLAGDATSGLWLIKGFLTHVRQRKLAGTIHVRCNTDSLHALHWSRFGFVRRRDFHRVMTSVPSSEKSISLLSEEGYWFVTAGDKDV